MGEGSFDDFRPPAASPACRSSNPAGAVCIDCRASLSSPCQREKPDLPGLGDAGLPHPVVEGLQTARGDILSATSSLGFCWVGAALICPRFFLRRRQRALDRRCSPWSAGCSAAATDDAGIEIDRVLGL